MNDETQFDPWDRIAAFSKAQEWGEKIPIGIFYETDRPSLDEQIPMIGEKCLVKQDIQSTSFKEMVEHFR
jgi:2-oxoglutarate ferredoxin oxidoreductase subunit beta